MRSSLASVLGLYIQDILSAKPRYTYVYIYIDTHAYAWVRGCVIICTYIYIYMYTHVYLYTKGVGPNTMK